MNIHVYDTYVKAKDGHIMHFDVFTAERNSDRAVAFAKEWLTSIGENNAKITTAECRFCHTEAASEDVAEQIRNRGYFIYKMEGCP